jgi:Rrf2 family protein
LFLTKESDYGIRIVRGLSDGRMKPVAELCEREMIPCQYAYKILKKLERAGIVEGARGPSGGYRLKRGTGELTLLDIVSCTDDDALMLGCLKEGAICPMNQGLSPCRIHMEMIRIQKLLNSSLSEKSMADILETS